MMKIIYSCYGGAHTSIVAAAIHMGLLPEDRIPSFNKIATVPFYDKTNTKSIGTPIYLGTDLVGNEVYVMGMGAYRKEGSELVYQFVNELYGRCKGEVLIVNSIALINLPIRIGGFLSRKINMVAIGKPITIFGIQNKYYSFVELVKNVKKTAIQQP